MATATVLYALMLSLLLTCRSDHVCCFLLRSTDAKVQDNVAVNEQETLGALLQQVCESQLLDLRALADRDLLYLVRWTLRDVQTRNAALTRGQVLFLRAAHLLFCSLNIEALRSEEDRKSLAKLVRSAATMSRLDPDSTSILSSLTECLENDDLLCDIHVRTGARTLRKPKGRGQVAEFGISLRRRHESDWSFLRPLSQCRSDDAEHADLVCELGAAGFVPQSQVQQLQNYIRHQDQEMEPLRALQIQLQESDEDDDDSSDDVSVDVLDEQDDVEQGSESSANTGTLVADHADTAPAQDAQMRHEAEIRALQEEHKREIEEITEGRQSLNELIGTLRQSVDRLQTELDLEKQKRMLAESRLGKRAAQECKTATQRHRARLMGKM